MKEEKPEVSKESPSEAKVEGAKEESKEQFSGSASKRRKTEGDYSQGYDYKGEEPKVGVIMALRSERLNHKMIYSSFIEKLKNYILSNFDDAKDVVPIVEELRDTMQDVLNDEPIELAPGEEKSRVKLWLKQEEVKRHMKRITNLRNNKETLYGLVWGQCSAGLQASIKADDDYEQQSKLFDCVWLLERAKLISSGIDEKSNKYCTLLKALTTMCTVRQGQNESNDSFRKRIDSVFLTVSLVGGEDFLYSREISAAMDPDAPIMAEMVAEEQKMKAMLMILRADQSRYGDLQDSLFEGMYKGCDEFPRTLVEAYDLLQRISNDIYQKNAQSQSKGTKRSFFRRVKQVGNVSFTQKGVSSELVPGRDGRVHEGIVCHNCHKEGHYANQCPHSKKKVTLAHFTLAQHKLELINKNWILLDTCSTVSVFCNSSLVHNIQTCKPGAGLTVVTNGGAQTYDHKAKFNFLPMNVHFNVHSIANILSLSDVANLPDTKITMDTSKAKEMYLHHKDRVYTFKECVDGLYYWDTSSTKPKSSFSHYSFINTVAENKSQYTKKDVEGAKRARDIQGIIAWPTDKQFQSIVSNNQLINSNITIDNITHATNIHGPATPLLQSRTVRKTPTSVNVQKFPLPPSIIQQYPNLQLYVDYFFVNRLPFLHTKSSKVDFLTVQTGENRTTNSILKGLKRVVNTYEKRGFTITDLHADNEFDIETLKENLEPINTHIYGKLEHVGTIERSVRTVKDRCRGLCHALPFKRYTKLMVHSLVENAVYWINAFPSETGAFNQLSPATIVLGRGKPDFSKSHIAFGSYAMVYNVTNNDMTSRTIPAIALRPSNEHGGSYFMSLLSGKKIHSNQWKELPIPTEVIDRVHYLAAEEQQPWLHDGVPTFEWNIGDVIEDNNEEQERHNLLLENQLPEIHQGINHDDAEVDEGDDPMQFQNETSDYASSDDNDEQDEILNDEDDEPLDEDPQQDSMDGFFEEVTHADEEQENNRANEEEVHEMNTSINNEFAQLIEAPVNSNEQDNDSNNMIDKIEVKDTTNEEDESNEVENRNTSVEEEETAPRRSARSNKGVISRMAMDHGGKDYRSYVAKQYTQVVQDKTDARKKKRHLLQQIMNENKDSRSKQSQFLQLAVKTVFLTAQMSAKKGIKQFGDRAIAAMVKEFTQLDQGAFPGKPVVSPVDIDSITPQEMKMAMEAVSLIKEKRNGVLKGRACANRSRQKRFLRSDESIASPTVSVEALLGTFVIDAYEGREIGSFDIPGAYLHAEMEHGENRVLLRLRDEFVDMMCMANKKYLPYVRIINGHKVLYLKVLRAIYGCIKSALLWYELFSGTLKKLGFVINPYDRCVANKMINGSQCTIVWYVDDAKVSHMERQVITDVIGDIEKEFGKMEITYGNVHDYLGMIITIKDRKVIIDMTAQVEELIEFFDDDIIGKVSSPANKNLMNVSEDSKLLGKTKKDNFHSTTAKMLYIEKRGRPDMELVTSFLTTRVSNPTEEDWAKLKRAVTFLKQTKDDKRIIGCDDIQSLYTWIDAAYAVHPNMRSQTGGTMSMGWGTLHNKSSKQKLNTKSSTESELVGLSKYLPYNLWWVNFLSEQGYSIVNNVIYQDNESTIRMARNGRNSCTGNSRHINIRYFFVKDRVDKKEIRIEHCRTENMLADYLTKPLQGSLFHQYRNILMGYDHISSLLSQPNNVINKERVEDSKNPELFINCESRIKNKGVSFANPLDSITNGSSQGSSLGSNENANSTDQ